MRSTSSATTALRVASSGRREITMSVRSNTLPEDVQAYLLAVSSREPPVLARLRAATAPRPEAEMQISPEQGQLMALLVMLIGAKRCIEIGTYTGYSALAVALALPADGRVIACDVSDEWTAIGRPFWREAGVESRIDLRIKPALQTLDELQKAGETSFDFAFVDADKPNYINYYEKLLQLMRPGGLIAIDNTLSVSGKPIIRHDSVATRALRAFNEHVHRDERVDISMLPIGEGLTLLRVRP
uniref:Predicted O-methyltransferase n=1 Tax=uncultured bacterium BLR8 TaxID=506524 RepID=C0IN68_9BACT|nr:predicted O-methyltransferase [uncultured bacterium BLR8]